MLLLYKVCTSMSIAVVVLSLKYELFVAKCGEAAEKTMGGFFRILGGESGIGIHRRAVACRRSPVALFAGQDKGPDLMSTTIQEGLCAGFQRRAGSAHVVNEQHVLA